jgi:hypothetical protein
MMMNEEKSLPGLERLLQDETTTKKDLDDLAWLIDHPEYEERPVDVKTFIDSPLYLDAKDECWEKIKDDLSELFAGYDDAEMRWKCNEAVFDEGIGAGKSYKTSIIIVYLLYRILILKNPQKFLHLARGSGIYFMNMSIRADQAKKVIFEEINQRVENAQWFKMRGYLPNPDIRSELQFPKNINIIPGNSKETFPLGFNLLGAVMDESAWYTETETHDVAEEMFNALNNRIKSRFGAKGMIAMISSPRYIDDFIEKKMEEAKTNTNIFARRRTSWESKPKSFFSGDMVEIQGVTIPKEYEIEARRNFDRFRRDCMAIPSLALEPYFKQYELLEKGIDLNIPNPLTPAGLIKIEFRGKPGYTYYMHIDLSLTTDATGIVMCHKEGDKIIIDLMMKIKPPPGREIDLSEIKSIVLELRARGFSIGKCTYDQFQSASSIQDLNKMGLNAERLSIDKDLSCYETLKEGIYAGVVKYYRDDDCMYELKRLELIKGKKVDHPQGQGGSKDLADALAGAVYNCVTASQFSFGFAGGDRLISPQEQLKEDAIRTADGRVCYGAYRGRRPPSNY